MKREWGGEGREGNTSRNGMFVQAYKTHQMLISLKFATPTQKGAAKNDSNKIMKKE
jgi:hypothetical protein